MTRGDRWLFWLIVGVGLSLLAWQMWPRFVGPASPSLSRRKASLQFCLDGGSNPDRASKGDGRGGDDRNAGRCRPPGPDRGVFLSGTDCLCTGWIRRPGRRSFVSRTSWWYGLRDGRMIECRHLNKTV